MSSNAVSLQDCKIGVFTIIHTCNYGAELQAYALCRIIERLGYGCELIDYVCPHVAEVETPAAPKLKNLKHPKNYLRSWLLLPERKRKQAAFLEFNKSQLVYGPKVTNEHDISERYRAVVVGSDQVWNGPVTGWDRTFLLADPACNMVRKLAYAASFGDSAIDEEELELYRRALGKFEAISTREKSGVSKVEGLSIAGAQFVLDPTLLLEYEEWRAIATVPSVKGPYVLAYFVNEHDSTMEYAEHVAAELGVRLVVTNRWGLRRKLGVVFRNAASPAEFIGLIANAEFVVTSSFHGACFSILFEKNFRSVLKPGTDKHRSRIYELLETLGLQEACFDGDASYEPLDYSKARIKLQSLRNESLDFLRLALAGDESVRITVEGQ